MFYCDVFLWKEHSSAEPFGLWASIRVWKHPLNSQLDTTYLVLLWKWQEPEVLITLTARWHFVTMLKSWTSMSKSQARKKREKKNGPCYCDTYLMLQIWPCKNNNPQTRAAKQRSYIGYQSDLAPLSHVCLYYCIYPPSCPVTSQEVPPDLISFSCPQRTLWHFLPHTLAWHFPDAGRKQGVSLPTKTQTPPIEEVGAGWRVVINNIMIVWWHDGGAGICSGSEVVLRRSKGGQKRGESMQ